MLKINEIAFSVATRSPTWRGRGSFTKRFWDLKATIAFGEAGSMQWTEYDIGSGTLALGAGAPDWQPRADGCSVGLEVDDFDAAIAHLRANQVKFKMEPFPTPVCQMAMISDPDGNTLCIHKRKG